MMFGKKSHHPVLQQMYQLCTYEEKFGFKRRKFSVIRNLNIFDKQPTSRYHTIILAFGFIRAPMKI